MILLTSVVSVVMSLISFLIVCISFLSVHILTFSFNGTSGTSLVAQLRIHLPVQEMQVRSLVKKLRSHIPQAT